MKTLLSSVLITSMIVMMAPSISAESVEAPNLPWECGNWEDVPSSMDSYLEEVCEHGLMMGYNEESFGYGKPLLRAELAQIVNRLAVTSDELSDLASEEEYDLIALSVNSMFSDIPDPNERAHEWMIWTMYFSAIEFDLMTGDDTGGWPTTFRATEGVNVPEAWKMLYEGAKYGELLSDDITETSFTYNGTSTSPWYDSLHEFLMENDLFYYSESEDYLVIELDESSPEDYDVSYMMIEEYFGMDTEINREDAAVFIYKMIEKGFLDSDAVKVHNGVY